jgi:hypothetical protein
MHSCAAHAHQLKTKRVPKERVLLLLLKPFLYRLLSLLTNLDLIMVPGVSQGCDEIYKAFWTLYNR